MAHRTWSFKLMASTVKNLTKDRTKNLTKSLTKSLIMNLIRILPKNLIKNLTKNQTLEYQVHQDKIPAGGGAGQRSKKLSHWLASYAELQS